MHLGTGLVCGYKILDMVRAGFDFTIFLADWHAWINSKLGGDMENIKFCGEYFIEGFSSIGLTPQKVKYVWASELAGNSEYWETLVKVAKKVNVSRVLRCLPIMGRGMDMTDVETASLIYPCMQVADIFNLNVDCACAGLDQRKAHMLARDVAEKLGMKKPVCIHTHLLLSLTGAVSKAEGRFDEDDTINMQISTKMSKSEPKSCIYIHDTPEAIRSKIADAYCPPREVCGNPVLEVAKYVVFAGKESLHVERDVRYGGPVEFSSFEELERSFSEGKLHPLDLKNSVSEALIELLEPVRSYFKGKSKMLQRMVELEITR